MLVSQLTLLSSEAPPTPTPTPAPTPAPRTPETPVSGEAVVSSLVGGTACPTLTFTIGSYPLTLSATTRYEGGTCADVRPGLRITLTGTRLGDGTIAVSTLVLRPEPARPQADVDGEGVVTSSVDGTACPALRVRIGEYTIAVDAATEYVRGSCTSLRPGVRIHVRGTATGERTVLASQISVQE